VRCRACAVTLALALAWLAVVLIVGCATTRTLKTEEISKTTWAATATTASQASSTSAKVEAVRKVRKTRRTEKMPDGTVVTTDTTTTTDTGTASSTVTTSRDTSVSTASGEAMSRSAVRDARQTRPSAGWLPWWGWVLGAAVIAGGLGWVVRRWGPGLWMRVMTRIG
jgi:cobalamin biosynthesis Mg chelatase CobN